jgi:hypothetical protein
MNKEFFDLLHEEQRKDAAKSKEGWDEANKSLPPTAELPKDKQNILGPTSNVEVTPNKEFAEGIKKDREELKNKPIKTLNVDA